MQMIMRATTAEKNLTFAPDELPETPPAELRDPPTRGYFRHFGPETPEARAVFYYDSPLKDSFSSTRGRLGCPQWRRPARSRRSRQDLHPGQPDRRPRQKHRRGRKEALATRVRRVPSDDRAEGDIREMTHKQIMQGVAAGCQ